jgi:iron complex transport system substrate-binding protein
MLDRTPSIAVEAGAWGCGGLELVQAAEQIAAALDRLDEPPP